MDRFISGQLLKHGACSCGAPSAKTQKVAFCTGQDPFQKELHGAVQTLGGPHVCILENEAFLLLEEIGFPSFGEPGGLCRLSIATVPCSPEPRV